MDRLLKLIQRAHPAAFCCRDFFLLHDNSPAHKATSVCQFLTPKNVTTLYHPPYSLDLSPPDYFLFPQLKMKLKGLHFVDVAEIQEAVTVNERSSKKRNFRQLFRKCTTAQKPLYTPMELILNTKKVCVFLMCLRFLEKSVLKPLDHTVHHLSETVDMRPAEQPILTPVTLCQRRLNTLRL